MQRPWLPDRWDVEADVVVVGFGGAGLPRRVTAGTISARRVVILEKAPEGQHGGNTRVAGQGYLNTSDPVKAARLSRPRCAALYRAGRRWCASGRRRCAATMTGLRARRRPAGASAPAGRHRIPDLPGRRLRAQIPRRPDLRLFLHLAAVRAAGEGAADPHPLRDAGARTDPARRHKGNPRRARRAWLRVRLRVKARRGVVLTCGGFENNQEMIRNYLPGVPYCYTSGTPYNEGDGITMAMSVGADLWHMNNYAGPSMALKVPEIRTSFSMQALHFSKQSAGRDDRGRAGRAALLRREDTRRATARCRSTAAGCRCRRRARCS